MIDQDDQTLAALDAVMSAHVGRAGAIKFAALKYQVNRATYPLVIGERSLRVLIETKRPSICFCTSAPGGYFLPSSDPDVKRREVGECINSINGYIRNLAKKRGAISGAYPEVQTQGNLFEEAGA